MGQDETLKRVCNAENSKSIKRTFQVCPKSFKAIFMLTCMAKLNDLNVLVPSIIATRFNSKFYC